MILKLTEYTANQATVYFFIPQILKTFEFMDCIFF